MLRGGNNNILFYFCFIIGIFEVYRYCLVIELIYNFVYWIIYFFIIIKIFNCFFFIELILLIYIRYILVKNRLNCFLFSWFLFVYFFCFCYL